MVPRPNLGGDSISPQGGRSRVKSSLKGKDNDQSRPRVDQRLKSSMGGRFKVKSSPKGKDNDQTCL